MEKGYEVKNGILLSYKGNETSIVLPSEISVLGNECFAFNENLISFTSSDNLKSIEKHAFHACCNLKSVKLNEGIETIEEFAFCSSGLSEIVIPNSVKQIGDKAFRCCSSLKKVVLPENLESISNNLFDFCGALEDIILPVKLITIGNEAFTMCSSLKKLVIPKSVKKIGDNAFGNNYSELQIEIQCADYRREGNFVFGPDNRLISYISNKIEKEIIIPEGTRVIGAYVFDRWVDIENVIFPKSLERIEETAFLNSMENLNPNCQEKIKSFYMAQANENVQKGKREIYMSK